MYGLKSAILAIIQKSANWLDWPCPISAALKTGSWDFFFSLVYFNFSSKQMFINFGFFPGPTALRKALCLLNFGFFSTGYGYFQVIRLFFLPIFPEPTFISCPTSIPDSRVRMQCSAFTLMSINLVYRARIIALPCFLKGVPSTLVTNSCFISSISFK